MDFQYKDLMYNLSLREHAYGPGVNLLSDPFSISLIAELCKKECTQPLFNQHIRSLYQTMGQCVANTFFSRIRAKVPTRMSEFHPEGVYEGEIFDPAQKIILVSLARAGTIPSNTLFEMYTNVISPTNVRVDHIYINRITDTNEKVKGAHMSGSKIGGSIENAIVLIADPMGATSGSISEVIEHYADRVEGKAKMWISLQLMITPEFIKNLHEKHKDVKIFSYRLDRAFSSKRALENIPGQFWNEEKGLNDKSYIVPGGGGFGELMSHSWV